MIRRLPSLNLRVLVPRIVSDEYKNVAGQLDHKKPVISFCNAADTAKDHPPEGSNGERHDNILTKTPEARLSHLLPKDGLQQALVLLEQAVYGVPTSSRGSWSDMQQQRTLKLPNAAACDSLLQSCAKNGAKSAAVRGADVALHLLRVHDVSLTAKTLLQLTQRLLRSNETDKALAIFEALLTQCARSGTQLHLSLLSELVDSAARRRNVPFLLGMFEQLLASGNSSAVNPTSISSLIQVFSSTGQQATAHALVEWMRRSGLAPSARTYTALLASPAAPSGPAAAKQLAQARRAYATMLAEGVAPDRRFYAAYLSVCARAHDVGAAGEAWQDMQSRGVVPDLEACCAMLDACAKGGDAARAASIFDAMRQHGIKPNNVALTAVLTALGTGSGAEAAAFQAHQVWEATLAAGVEPNDLAKQAYLGALVAQGNIEAAVQLVSDMGGSVPSTSSSALDTYHFLMLHTARMNNHKLVLQLYDHMRAAGLAPTSQTHRLLLLAQSGRSAASWLLTGSSSGAQVACSGEGVELPPQILESCVRGQGSAAACADALLGGCWVSGEGEAGPPAAVEMEPAAEVASGQEPDESRNAAEAATPEPPAPQWASWRDFQAAHKGQGLAQKELSARWKAHKASRDSGQSPQALPAAPSAESAEVQAGEALVTWAQWQKANKGQKLTRQQMGARYQEYKASWKEAEKQRKQAGAAVTPPPEPGVQQAADAQAEVLAPVAAAAAVQYRMDALVDAICGGAVVQGCLDKAFEVHDAMARKAKLNWQTYELLTFGVINAPAFERFMYARRLVEAVRQAKVRGELPEESDWEPRTKRALWETLRAAQQQQQRQPPVQPRVVAAPVAAAKAPLQLPTSVLEALQATQVRQWAARALQTGALRTMYSS